MGIISKPGCSIRKNCVFLINQFKMKTKKQLQQEGWLFITLSGGALSASKKINDNDRIAFNAKTLLTLRKKIAQWK